jgi:hypothetical protein
VPDGVQIDTDGVGDVGRGLRAAADSGFAANADRGASLHRHGVEFGARITPSSEVTAAKQRYAQALANTEANLRAYHVAAGVLADAAEEIVRLFASSDLSSAQAQRKVQDLIDGAVGAANEAVGGTVDGAM